MEEQLQAVIGELRTASNEQRVSFEQRMNEQQAAIAQQFVTEREHLVQTHAEERARLDGQRVLDLQRIAQLEAAGQQGANQNAAVQGAQPVMVAPQGAGNRVKLPRPENFHGATQTGPDVDAWLFKLDEYYEVMQTATNVKVGFAAALLCEAAADWWRVRKTAAQQAGEILNWETFKQELAVQFRVISSVTKARDQLYASTHSRFQPVSDFCRYFRSIVVKIPDMSEEDKLHLFTRKLHDGL